MTFTMLSAKEYSPDAKKIFALIRCPVCEGQTLESSQSLIAEDIKNLIEKRLSEAYTTEQIVSQLQNIYGDAVLQKPPIKKTTYLLWAGPYFILLILGCLWVYKKYTYRKE